MVKIELVRNIYRPAYHHTVSSLSNVTSNPQYDYDSHIEAWLLSRIKVVGPNMHYAYSKDMSYMACIGDYDYDKVAGYGYSPSEAKAELMAQLGY